MPAEDFNNGQSGQNNQPFSDQPQGQTQAQDGVPEPADEPLDEKYDTGTEALTGMAPQEGLGDQQIDNAGTDNFAPQNAVEEVDTDLTTESAGGAEPLKGNIDLDEEDAEMANSEDEDGDGI